MHGQNENERTAVGERLGGLVPQRRRPVEGGARGRDKRDLARTLSSFPDFAACGQGDLEALAGAGRVTSLPARWTFLHERTPADACYVLLGGQVQVLRGGVVLAALGPGCVLGEMALLGRSLRRASVVTSTPVQALRVEHDVLAELLRARPHLATAVGAVYAQRRAADEGERSTRAPGRLSGSVV